MRPDLRPTEGIAALWMTLASCLLAVLLVTPAVSDGVAPLSMNPALQSAAAAPYSQSPPGEDNQGGYADPLSGCNKPMPSPSRSIPC